MKSLVDNLGKKTFKKGIWNIQITVEIGKGRNIKLIDESQYKTKQ